MGGKNRDVFKGYTGNGIVYRCSNCRCDLALHDELISKAFQGRHGRGFLFNHAINVQYGPHEDRVLTTGLHTVCDVYCEQCESQPIGWCYVRAENESQKYKEGKILLEKHCLHIETNPA